MANFKNRGVRKVSEQIISEGRSLVIDYLASDRGEIEWDDIPAGSIGVDSSNGKLYVKLLATSWWTEIQIGSGSGGSQTQPGTGWDQIDIPLDSMTEAEVLTELDQIKILIQDIEIAIYGANTTWVDKYYYSDKIRYARAKILEIAEGVVSGASTVLRAYPASNTREALDSINTMCDVVVTEGINP